MPGKMIPWNLYFNSRPCVRGDLSRPGSWYLPLIFQFAPLREGRPWSGVGYYIPEIFQFAPLREGRPRMATSWVCW